MRRHFLDIVKVACQIIRAIDLFHFKTPLMKNTFLFNYPIINALIFENYGIMVMPIVTIGNIPIH